MQGTVKARRLILSCQTWMMTASKAGQKFSPCDAASHGLTAYKSAQYKQNFEIELLLCRSLYIAVKNTRLKPRLIKNKFFNNKY